MQRLLIPIDGSEPSTRAVRHVIEKAKRVSGAYEIHIVNVQPPLPGSFVSPEQVASFHHDESEKVLLSSRKLLDEAGLPYQAHLLAGPLAETIVSLCDKLGCDEIVMGSHGRSALADLLIGSTVTRVVHLSKVPVLLVK